jgi:hypothetical protein
MSIFSKILNGLGIGKEKEEEAPKAKPVTPISAGEAAAARARRLERIRAIRAERESKKIPLVDVVGKLETMASEKAEELNWKTSIVDLLKLLDIESSFEARKELAIELECPADLMDDSAEMNMWLHKTVLEKIAENGGNVPMELLD